MKTLHPIQISILEQLLFSQGLKFSALKVDSDIQSNQLTFHVNTLVEAGLIQKNEQLYVLTDAGKLYANSKDSHRDPDHKFQKIGVLMACSRQNDNGEVEYLCYTRKKHPFFGKQGFPTGKILWGEKPVETATRELMEETNLQGKAQLIKLIHYINKNTDGGIIEDKYLFLCHIPNPIGDIVSNNEGDFYRVAKSDMKVRLIDTFDPIDDFIGMTDAIESFECVTFEEKIVTPKGF